MLAINYGQRQTQLRPLEIVQREIKGPEVWQWGQEGKRRWNWDFQLQWLANVQKANLELGPSGRWSEKENGGSAVIWDHRRIRQWSEKENGGREAGSRWKDQFVTDIRNWLLRHWAVPPAEVLSGFPISIHPPEHQQNQSNVSPSAFSEGTTAAFHAPPLESHNTVSISERLVGAGSICGWI